MPSLTSLAGTPVDPANLQHPQAKAFASHIGMRRDGAYDLVECRVLDVLGRTEAVVFDVRPELPQRPVFDFLETERLCVLFYADRAMPDVLSLRGDFPHVPHMNIVGKADLSWICLFGEDPDEVRRRLTPQLLADRILWWFAQNAIGELIQGDQALEPFLAGAVRPIYFPRAVFESGERIVVGVFSAYTGTDREVIVADDPAVLPPELKGQHAALYPLTLPVQTAGVIYHEPETLRDLVELCAEAQYDLLTEIAKLLRETAFKPADAVMTLLLLAIPKGPSADSAAISTEYRAFRLGIPGPQGPADASPGQLAVHVGLGALQGGKVVPLIGASLTLGDASKVVVSLLAPQQLTTRDQAAWLNGSDGPNQLKIIAVGAGALGSQVFGCLVRKGFGEWVLIDADRLEPHNFARHEIFGRRYGIFKAEELASRANEIFKGPPAAVPIVADIGNPKEMKDQIGTAMKDASLVLDMSASTAVARRLVEDYESAAPRLSLFLSPSGRDLIALFEGRDRGIRVDAVEMQYLRAVINLDGLSGLLIKPSGALRYGAGCRDRSVRIPNELVSLHGSIGARAVETLVNESEPRILIWRCNPDSMEVARTEIPLEPMVEVSFGEWRIVYDSGLLSKLAAMRAAKLPKETCGVLLGQFDAFRNRLYLIDALPAPSDSEEQPGWCKRGIDGLSDAIEEIRVRSGGDVEYVGEWHSHPEGSSCLPSERDAEQLAWICDHMHPAGLPAAIMIACEGPSHTLFLSMPGAGVEKRTLA